jgi:endonuclease/exonuclease/phosphatase (EEP) superfamily protein YafD
MMLEPSTAADPGWGVKTFLRGPSFRKGVAAFLVAAALVHPLAGLFSRRSWLADMLCHFREPALVATLLAVAVTALSRRRIAVGLAVLAVFQVGPVLRYSWPNPVTADPASTERLRVLSVNVLHESASFDAVAALIRDERPDVVGLLEYTRQWREGLSAVRDEYPYRAESLGLAGGIALWFRRPPVRIDPPVPPAPGGHPMIHAVFEFAGKTRHLWLVHPRSPVTRSRIRAGNPELDAIAARVAEADGSRVVVGDMNTTDGSAHFQDFLRVSGLRDSRLGFGRQPSWPTDLPFGLAIDHAFVSPDLAVVDRRLGPYVGSDHFPLVVDLAPAATKSSTQPAH